MSYGLSPTSTGFNPTTTNTGAVKEKIPKGYSKGSLQNFTPEQMNLFGQMFGQVGPDSYLSKLAGGDEATFNQMEAPALRQFSGLQGNLASRFSGMGAGGQGRALGARRSSGFQNTMNSAASNFAQELQAQRQGLMSNARKELFDMSSQLLSQKPYENILTEKPKPWWQNALSGLAGGVGQGFGQSFGQSSGKFLFGGG